METLYIHILIVFSIAKNIDYFTVDFKLNNSDETKNMDPFSLEFIYNSLRLKNMYFDYNYDLNSSDFIFKFLKKESNSS